MCEIVGLEQDEEASMSGIKGNFQIRITDRGKQICGAKVVEDPAGSGDPGQGIYIDKASLITN